MRWQNQKRNVVGLPDSRIVITEAGASIIGLKTANLTDGVFCFILWYENGMKERCHAEDG